MFCLVKIKQTITSSLLVINLMLPFIIDIRDGKQAPPPGQIFEHHQTI